MRIKMIVEPTDLKPEMEKLRNIAKSVTEVVTKEPEEKPEPESPQDMYVETISKMKSDGPFFQFATKK